MHHYTCGTPTVVFAYLALGYLIASVVYLLVTRDLGTPFKDSLLPEQRAILAESKEKRRKAFLLGVALAVLAMCFVRPFGRK